MICEISKQSNIYFKRCLQASAIRTEHATAALKDSTSLRCSGVGILISFD